MYLDIYKSIYNIYIYMCTYIFTYFSLLYVVKPAEITKMP